MFSNTVINPLTMMIKSLDTHITVITMGGSWRPINKTSIAELEFEWMCFYGGCVENRLILTNWAINIFLTDGNTSKLLKFIIAKYFGYNSWISKCKYPHHYYGHQFRECCQDDENHILFFRWKHIEKYHTNDNGE